MDRLPHTAKTLWDRFNSKDTFLQTGPWLLPQHEPRHCSSHHCEEFQAGLPAFWQLAEWRLVWTPLLLRPGHRIQVLLQLPHHSNARYGAWSAVTQSSQIFSLFMCVGTKNFLSTKIISMGFFSLLIYIKGPYIRASQIFWSKGSNSTGNFGPKGEGAPILNDILVYFTTLQDLWRWPF